MTTNPHRAREAATDVIMILGTQGISACAHAATDMEPEVAAAMAQELAAKLEWSFLTLGVNVAEILASTLRVRALAAEQSDSAFDQLMSTEFPEDIA